MAHSRKSNLPLDCPLCNLLATNHRLYIDYYRGRFTLTCRLKVWMVMLNSAISWLVPSPGTRPSCVLYLFCVIESSPHSTLNWVDQIVKSVSIPGYPFLSYSSLLPRPNDLLRFARRSIYQFFRHPWLIDEISILTPHPSGSVASPVSTFHVLIFIISIFVTFLNLQHSICIHSTSTW